MTLPPDDLDPEVRELDTDTDAEDGEPVGQDATPDVRTDTVAPFEGLEDPEAETAAGTEPNR